MTVVFEATVRVSSEEIAACDYVPHRVHDLIKGKIREVRVSITPEKVDAAIERAHVAVTGASMRGCMC